ncbi:GDP-mannose mannosyl hydrolase [Microbulbifer aestuariivivens]|uniref:GDP-mannose mannosyl hydrolase n=1 Tax=Microbulbifer aestuariivivens TaxID=1908308 RepID=A0ABP9WS05_9GAMM
MKLAKETFKTVVSSTPLVSIDLVVRNGAGQILLGERLNRPAIGYWFVPGGRIVKGEPMAAAFERLTFEELGVRVSLGEAQFLGPFEHFYQDNFSGADFSTHYVVLGYQLQLDVRLEELPREQHARYQWWAEADLLASSSVHVHTKWYL